MRVSTIENPVRPTPEAVTPDSLTVVVPSKNREDDILRCLTSISAQSTQPDQVIIVDQSQRPYRLGRFSDVLHLHRPDLSGLTAAKNYALKSVQSEWVLFLDDDIEMLSDCVAALKQEFLRHPNAAAIGCSITQRAGLSMLGWLREILFRHGFFGRKPIKRDEDVELRILSGGASAIRRRVLDEELFDEQLRGVAYGEDFEFSIRARLHGRFWLCRSAKVYHHASPANRSASQRERRNIWNHTLYFYDKFNAGKHGWNKLWLLLWMLGESTLWLRLGMGMPPIVREFRRRLRIGGQTPSPDSG